MPKTSLQEQREPLRKALSVFPLLQGLTQAQIDLLAEYVTPRSYPQGKVIFEQGTHRDSLFLITKGRLSVYKEFGDEPEVFAVLNPGEFCCEEALSDPHSVHSKSAQALDGLEVLALSHTAYHALAKEDTAFALLFLERILRTIAERLHHADNKLVTLYHTGRIISITLPLEEIGQQILSALHEVVRARRSLFAMFSQGKNQISIIAQHGFAVSPFHGNSAFTLNDDPVLGLIAQTQATLLVTPTNTPAEKRAVAYATDSMLGVPIKHAGTTIGAILMLDKEGEEFNINNTILLEIVARQIAGAVAEAQSLRKHKDEEELKQVYIRPM